MTSCCTTDGVAGTFYYLTTLPDGYSRSIVHWEIRTTMTEQDEQVVLQRALERFSAYVGKWHHGSQSGKRPGFDYSASFVGQGKYFDCPVEINGVATPTKGFIDDVTTDYAAEFIRNQKDRPFLLILGYKTCHGPFTPPPRHEKTYEGEEARRVPNLGAGTPYRSADAKPAGGRAAATRSPDAPTVPTNLGMFRGITAIDDNVGKLLQLLDELKLSDDTVVCFASDNGYYLGEHGLGDKRSAYEEALRIPLLLR